MSIKLNTLGVSRSLMNKFTEFKKSSPKLNDSGGKLLNDGNPKYNLLNNSSREVSRVMSSGDASGPDHIDIFERTNKLFMDIESKFTKLKEEQQRRLMPRFDDDENIKINKSISIIVSDITKSINQCEAGIKQMQTITCNSQSEENMKRNMRLNLTGKLKELTMKISRNEESYLKKFQDLGLEDPSSRQPPSEKSKNTDFLEMSMSDNILREREVRINDLVKSINDLAGIFKEMQNLVNEQGTILDRIDYNIDTAVTNTIKANTHLKKAEEIQEKSSCVRNAIMALIVLNFLLAFILIMKFVN